MRHLIFVTSIFLFSLNCVAQNWKPLNQVSKYNYVNSEDRILTVWVDSVEINGSDTVLFMNKVLKKVKDNSPISYILGYYLKGQSQFFLSQVVNRPGGDFFFYDSDSLSFLIKTQSDLNDAWLFDTIRNISASISRIDTQSVFNLVDSVKTILLSSGDSIIISKNFGILFFPVMDTTDRRASLVGIEGVDVGERVPDFFDIFTMKIGDILFDKKSHSNYWGNEVEYLKIEILDVTVGVNNVVVNTRQSSIKYLHHNYGGGEDTAVTQPSEILVTYNLGDYPFINKYSYEIVGNGVEGCDNKPVIVANDPVFNVISKSYPYYQFCPYWGSDTIVETNHAYFCSYYTYLESYAKGLGLLRYNEYYWVDSWHSESRNEHLIGLISGGDTLGQVLNDSLFLIGINDDSRLRFIVYPILVEDYFYVETEDYFDGNDFTISLFDINGRLLYNSQLFNSLTRIDVKNIEGGMYFVLISNGNQCTTKKIFKE